MIDVDNPPTSNFHPDVQPAENYSDDQLFNWQEISARCISPTPNHPAYGMSVSEYIKKRSQFENPDDKKVQLHFRLFPEIVLGIPILSRVHHVSPTKYVSYLLELGLITFQHDYHEKYSLINYEQDRMFNGITSEEMFQIMMWSQKYTITLKSASRDNKMFSPSVPDWMYDAIRSTSMALNAPQSDICCMCICIGIGIDAEEFHMPDAYLEKTNSIIGKFEFCLNMMYNQIEKLMKKE